MRIVISATARTDLRETLAFYRAPSQRADTFAFVFASGVRHLRQWPYTGHRRRDLSKEDICFWFEDPFLLVIQINDEVLSIVAVLHSSRDVARVLRERFKKSRSQ